MGPETTPLWTLRFGSQKAASKVTHRSSHGLNNKLAFIKVLGLIPGLKWDGIESGKRLEEAENKAPVSQAHHLAKLLEFPGWEASCTKGAFLGGSRFWAEIQSCCGQGGEGEGSAPQLLVVPTFNFLPFACSPHHS